MQKEPLFKYMEEDTTTIEQASCSISIKGSKVINYRGFIGISPLQYKFEHYNITSSLNLRKKQLKARSFVADDCFKALTKKYF